MRGRKKINKCYFGVIVIVALSLCLNLNNEKESDIMNKFVDSKVSYVDLLASEYNPPANPKCVVNDDVKNKVESRLGTRLPKDYYDYINTFGYGSFDNYVKVVNFFHEDGVDEYFQESSDNEEIMNDLKEMRNSFGVEDTIVNFEKGNVVSAVDDYTLLNRYDDEIRSKLIKCGTGYPYQFYKNGTGLIYWGRTDDCNFFWNYCSDGYSVVAYCDNDFYEFNMSFSEFLYHFLDGNMKGLYDFNNDFTYKEYSD